MSLHTWLHQGPCKPSSCSTFTLNSHWGRAATGKKILASMREGSLRLCPTLCDPVDCGLEKAMAAHSSILAWRIPGTGEPGGLLSLGLHRVGHD